MKVVLNQNLLIKFERFPAGSVIDIEAEEAGRLVQAGVVQLAEPLVVAEKAPEKPPIEVKAVKGNGSTPKAKNAKKGQK